MKRLRLPKGIVYGTKSFVCRHVFEGSRPVLYISRRDGDWCFLCGDLHPQDPGWFLVVGLGHEIEKDRTLLEILDLAPEEDAERDEVGGPWTRGQIEGS